MEDILDKAPEILEALKTTEFLLEENKYFMSAKNVKTAIEIICAMKSALERVTRERDAAVSDISLLGNCCVCKKYPGKGVRCKSAGRCHFEWRGVTEVDDGTTDI